MASITRELRGRPVTAEEAKVSVQRLINSHFHNKDSARCSIPARAEDDDIVASDWVQESIERIAELEAKLAALEPLLRRAIIELEYIQCVENCHSGLCATSEGKAIVESGTALLGLKDLADPPVQP